MDCMTEIDEDVEQWAKILDDEEDDDDDELMKLGGEVVDRSVLAFTIKKIGSSYFQAIGHYVNQQKWQEIHAGLSAISEGVEYVENEAHLDELADLCLRHTVGFFFGGGA